MNQEPAILAATTGSRAETLRRRYWLVIAVLIIGALLVPLLGSRYHVSFMFFFCLALTLTATYEIIGGYMGYINMGHGAFFGLGAYAYGIIITYGGPIALGLLVAVIVVALFAWLLALPLFRLHGAYFAIATFGVLMVMLVLATNLRDLTGGTTGLSITPTESTIPTYYLMLLTAVMAMGLNAWVASSRFGLGLLSIREDEEVAEATGINTTRYKQGVMVLSSLLPGFAGGVYMWHMTYADPNSTFGAEVHLCADHHGHARRQRHGGGGLRGNDVPHPHRGAAVVAARLFEPRHVRGRPRVRRTCHAGRPHAQRAVHQDLPGTWLPRSLRISGVRPGRVGAAVNRRVRPPACAGRTLAQEFNKRSRSKCIELQTKGRIRKCVSI